MLLNKCIEAVKILSLHKDAKLGTLHKVSNTIKILKEEVDYEIQQQLDLFDYIIRRRLSNDSFTKILTDIMVEHPHLYEDAQLINESYSYEDLENYSEIVQNYYNNKKIDQIVSKLEKTITDIKLEEFPSVSEKLNFLRETIDKTFEDLSSIDISKDENEFIVDTDVDIEEQIEDDKEILTISTGFRSLDNALYGGFQSGRLYIFTGGTGKGKSLILNNITVNLAKTYQTSDFRKKFEKEFSTYKPCIVFVTNENLISETRLRIASIIDDTSPDNPNLSDKKYQAKLFADFVKKTGIVLYFKYVPPRSVTAYDIYSMMISLEHQRGYKPIALVVDYLDRLRSIHKSDQERFVLGYITDELKAISIKANIPVITATQLNREGNKSEDPTLETIGESWKKVENADSVILFNPERLQNEPKWIYRIKVPKLRYGAPTNDPIILERDENKLKLIEQGQTIMNSNQNLVIDSSPSNPIFTDTPDIFGI